jgi:hypothetical protein
MPKTFLLARHSAAVFAAFAGLIILATPIERALGQKPASPVTVVNPATGPGLTSSVDDPGRIPYQAQHKFATGDCLSALFQCIFNFPAVPAGKRLVAQHIVVSAVLSSGTEADARIVIGDVVGSHFFVPTVVTPSGTSVLGDQSVQVYVDGGSSFQAGVFTDGAFAIDPALGVPVVLMTVTGYLLDCTVNECAAIAP